MEKRALVVEWRFTSIWFGWTIRYWVESNPEHGGVERDEALRLVGVAEKALIDQQTKTQEAAAAFLLAEVPCANSVEVCDENGDGVALHRDWP